jgi:hypothetical protein
MNFCFLSNYYRTLFFERVAHGLTAQGVNVFWIAASRRWADELIRLGTPAERILCLADFRDEWLGDDAKAPDADDPDLARLEQSGISANEIILMDRELRKRPHAKTYLAVIAREIGRFLARHDIHAAFGEETWGFELVTAQLCAVDGRDYLAPFTIRVPSERFAFFRGIAMAEVVEFGAADDEDRRMAGTVLEALTSRGSRPYYFHIHNKVRHLRRHWFGEGARQLFSKQTAGDETLPSIRDRFGWRFMRSLNTYRVRWQRPFLRDGIPGERPFVLVTLHMQPEASVDVLASRNSDQIENIRALSRLIPQGWEIYVKEHSNAIGVRSPRYYDELRRIPAVRLIDPHADTFRLVQASQLVLSPSGTVCFEAGLLGRKAATLAPMYFGPVMNPGAIDLSVLDRTSFEHLLRREDHDGRMEPLAFLSWLHAQSFPGRVGDPVHDPGSMTDENVAAVVDGFMALARLKGARQQPNASAA